MRALIRTFVASLLLCLAGPAQAAWHEAKSKHFIIYANESEAYLRAYAEKLERFDQAVRYILKFSDPPLTDSGRVTIFVLNNEDAIEKLTGYKGVRGIYRPTAAGSYAFVPRRSGMTMVQGMSNGTGTSKDSLTGEIIFFHEYAHHLQLQHRSGVMPAWVVEGFAEFFATTDVDVKGNVTIGKFPSHRSWEVFVGSGLSAQELVQADFDKLAWYDSYALYGRSWLLMHYLSLSGGRQGQLGRYLDGLEKGVTPLEAGRTAFGDLKVLSKDLDAYAAPRKFLALTIDSKMLSPGPVAVRPLGSGEAAIMPARMRSKYKYRVEKKGDASQVAAVARSAASSFPDDPTAQAALAEAEFDAKNYAAAKVAAERVLAVQPGNVHALIYKGRTDMALAKAQPQGDWDRPRGIFLRANKLDTENAQPLELYFDSFVEARQSPTKNAVDGLLYAVDLAPQDDDLRIKAVRQLLAESRIPEAKTMFAPTAYDPHRSKEWRAQIPKIMKALDTGAIKEALTLLDAAKAKEDKDSD